MKRYERRAILKEAFKIGLFTDFRLILTLMGKEVVVLRYARSTGLFVDKTSY